MKRSTDILSRSILLALIIALSLSLFACGGASEHGEVYYTVNYYIDGACVKTAQVKEGEPAQNIFPGNDVDRFFAGWYTTPDCRIPYMFGMGISGDLNLYAKYDVNAKGTINEITESVIRGLFYIKVEHYKKDFFGIEYDLRVSFGSGFAFKEKDGGYYILTNTHVVAPLDGYKVRYTAVDYNGVEHKAYIYESPTKGQAYREDYDLACLYFKEDGLRVKPMEFAEADPAPGADVIALGAPNGQRNAITIGKVRDYAQITLTGTTHSDVKFEVIRHTAKSNPGSSGGPLLDSDLKVIGVNYSGVYKDANDLSQTSMTNAVPLSRVFEFLEYYSLA